MTLRRGIGDVNDNTSNPLGPWWCSLFGPAAPTLFTQCPGIFYGSPANPLAAPDTSGSAGPSDWMPYLIAGAVAFVVGVMIQHMGGRH